MDEIFGLQIYFELNKYREIDLGNYKRAQLKIGFLSRLKLKRSVLYRNRIQGEIFYKFSQIISAVNPLK
ncbi:MAG: hypothetical protein CL596_06425 [Alteromonas sp.]|nr:hypothetical protein [Alteromonas sp.]